MKRGGRTKPRRPLIQLEVRPSGLLPTIEDVLARIRRVELAPRTGGSVTRVLASSAGPGGDGGGGGVTDHGLLTGLTPDDDHPHYAQLAGRAGGQTLIGGTAAGERLNLKGTAHATPGPIRIGRGKLQLDSEDSEDPIFGTLIPRGVIQAVTPSPPGSGNVRDVLYTYETVPGWEPSHGYLTFPVGFKAISNSRVTTPANTIPNQILTVQPHDNAATGSGDAVFGQMFVGPLAPAAIVRGLRYEVGANPPTGGGSIAELIGCLTGLRSALPAAAPVTLAAYFRGDPFVWAAAVPLTSVYGIDLPALTRGTNRWGGGRSRNPSANAGSYAYGWQVDQFSGAVTNQYPFYYGDPLAANRGLFSVDRYGSIHTAAELATTIGPITLANGANNDIAVGTKSFIRITGPTAGFNITGIAGGFDGKRLILYNATAQSMILNNENVGSAVANRIITHSGGDRTTTGTGLVELIYSATDSRWIVVSFEV